MSNKKFNLADHCRKLEAEVTQLTQRIEGLQCRYDLAQKRASELSGDLYRTGHELSALRVDHKRLINKHHFALSMLRSATNAVTAMCNDYKAHFPEDVTGAWSIVEANDHQRASMSTDGAWRPADEAEVKNHYGITG